MSRDPAKTLYEFGPFRLDPAEHTLVREGQPVLLTPKVFDILKLLVENSGHLFEKDELMTAVWADSFVEEGNLTRNISTLRTALGESAEDHKYIETVPKRGYRFIAPVRQLNGGVTLVPVVSNPQDGPAVYPAASPAPDGSAISSRFLRGYQGWALAALAILAAAGLAYGVFFRRAASPREPAIRSIAILPVKSLSREIRDEYGLGLTDTIITSVNQIDGLTVRPLSAVKKYDGQGVNSLEAGRKEQVDSVLESTIQGTADRLRVNFNLLRTEDGVTLWSETYDWNLTNIFEEQDKLAQHVANRLALKLRPQMGRSRPVNAEANRYYLAARRHMGTENRSENDRAIELLGKAIATDPTFPLAHAALAGEYHFRGVALEPGQKDEWEAKAAEEIDKSLSLDPYLADAYVVRAMMVWGSGKQFSQVQAIKELRRALDLNPNLDDVHYELANVYNHIGLLEQAQYENKRALEINPDNSGAQFRIGVNLLYQSRYGEALTAFRETRKYNPALWSFQMAFTQFQLGKREDAAATIADARKNAEQEEGGLLTSMEAILAASSGDNRKAEEKIVRAVELGKDYIHFHHTEYAIASAYALMNKRAAALEWLKKAAADGFPCYPLYEKDHNLDSLRQDPEFIAFMAKLKDEWEQYKATL